METESSPEDLWELRGVCIRDHQASAPLVSTLTSAQLAAVLMLADEGCEGGAERGGIKALTRSGTSSRALQGRQSLPRCPPGYPRERR